MPEGLTPDLDSIVLDHSHCRRDELHEGKKNPLYYDRIPPLALFSAVA